MGAKVELSYYICQKNLDIYDSAECRGLATQSALHRYLTILQEDEKAVKVQLAEDGYQGWLPKKDLIHLIPTPEKYSPQSISRADIEIKIPQIVKFALKAMETSNYYLWGGTVAPHYDCSGLVQSAYVSEGIWLPRDSYQQEEFCINISKEELEQGDLIFFGKQRVTHVAIYLGEGRYIHSSGKDLGNNGIGINYLQDGIDKVSSNYYQEFWSCGRINKSFCP
ncbi:MAG: C40 family peptidase [Cyanobacterium sp. T60_A2020_053]|nr:C40 family peptidase [Cyanobacterium sp. T60_A2020_053]